MSFAVVVFEEGPLGRSMAGLLWSVINCHICIRSSRGARFTASKTAAVFLDKE